LFFTTNAINKPIKNLPGGLAVTFVKVQTFPVFFNLQRLF
jgi:hypothetical protein